MPETSPRLPLESDDARAPRLVTVVTAVMRDCFFGRSDVVPAPERLQQHRQLMSRHTLSSLDAPRRALFVSDVVDALDLSPILATYETGDGRGQPPYHPAWMVKLRLYASCMAEAEQRLQPEIAALLAEAQRVEAAEDGQSGQGRRGDERPAELARRASRLAKLREAQAAREADAKAQAVAAADAAQAKLADRERRAARPPGTPKGGASGLTGRGDDGTAVGGKEFP